MSLYEYVYSNPIQYIDFNGKRPAHPSEMPSYGTDIPLWAPPNKPDPPKKSPSYYNVDPDCYLDCLRLNYQIQMS